MTYHTLYRKYRSQSFHELEGQSHIIQILSNAITLDRVCHAYIFSGPRGTGKTSTARIFAKSLNCRKGPSTTPCQTCDICQKITASQSIDIIELDAASHTGVDDIRALTEQVQFVCVESLYKVFIIDEVHMLSSQAFNALLKTLEEPPHKTVFILATTEPQKIPATIHSRCQHLHFQKLTLAELSRQLTHIASQEGIVISQDALHILAKRSGGGMRDAIMLLDQLVAFHGTTLTNQHVLEMTGGANTLQLIGLCEAILGGDAPKTIELLRHLFLEGTSVHQLVPDLIEMIRHLSYTSMGVPLQYDVEDSLLLQLKQWSTQISIPATLTLLKMLTLIENEFRWFPNNELLLEVRLLSWLQENPKTTPSSPPKKPLEEKPLEKKQPPLKQKAEDFQSQWHQFLAALKIKKMSLYSILDQCQIETVTQTTVHVKLKQNFKFFCDKLNEEASKELLTALLQEACGTALVIKANTPATDPTTQKTTPSSLSSQQEPPDLPKKINDIVALFEGYTV